MQNETRDEGMSRQELVAELAELRRRVAEVESEEYSRKRTEKLLSIQRDLGLALGAAASLQEGLEECVAAAIKASDMDCGGVYLVDEETGAMDLAYQTGLSASFVRVVRHYDADNPHARLATMGHAAYMRYEELGVPFATGEYGERLQALAVVPFSHEDRVIGCLNMASHTVPLVPQAARAGLEAIASRIGEAVALLKTREALRKSEARTRAILNALPDLMFRINREGVFVGYEGAQDRLYAPPDVFLNRPVEEVLPPTLSALTKERVAAALETGEMQVYEYPILMEGKECHFEARMVVAGENEVVVIVRDITGRKEKEVYLQLLSSAVEQVAEGIGICDWEGRLMFVNRALARKLGREPESLLGESLDGVHGAEGCLSLEEVGKAVRERGGFRGKMVCGREGGEALTATVCASLLRDAMGKDMGVILVVTETRPVSPRIGVEDRET